MAKGKKTGGRQKGTPNKENPLKGFLRDHSMKYFEPHGQEHPITKELAVISDFEADMLLLDSDQRVAAEIKILEFHTPKMKAVDISLEAEVSAPNIEERLRQLCGEDPEEEEE